VPQVILPEGSTDLAAEVPFSVAQSRDVRYTYLDTVGRPVLVLQKQNVVMEHNQHFQVAATAHPAQRWHATLALHACLARLLHQLKESIYTWHGSTHSLHIIALNMPWVP
jgi:hypothetical protein